MKENKSRKVVILSNTGEDFPIEERRIAQEEKTVLKIRQFTDEDSIISACEGAYIVAFSDAPITKRVIESLSSCRMLIRYGVGIDKVDLTAAKANNILVCNAPTYGSIDVAEHAFALMLSLSRQTVRYDNRIRSGCWDVGMDRPTSRLHGKTLGLVGFGRIARHLCASALGLGMHVLTYDPFIDDELARSNGAEKADITTLLSKADCISLHLPLNPDTHHFLNKASFEAMKESAFIINTGRGSLINLDDLVQALKDGQIGGAALDVYPNEPLPTTHPIFSCDNVVLTPHMAWYSRESIVSLHEEVTDDIVRVLRGTEPLNKVF